MVDAMPTARSCINPHGAKLMWTGEGSAVEHTTMEWRLETARLTARIRATTGGRGEVVVSFAGKAVVNGTYEPPTEAGSLFF